MSFRIFSAAMVVAPILLASGCAHQKASVVAPAIVTPAEWGSKPQPFPAEYNQTPRAVLLHHAGENWKLGTDPAQKLRNLQSWGQRDKNWNDVPYHYLISPDGRIFEGRSVSYKPDTNTNFDTTGFINVQLWGNFEEQRVTQAQLASTVSVTAYLVDKHGLSIDSITTHMDEAPGQTTCPGKDFYRYVKSGQFREWVQESLKGKTPKIELLPALEGGPTEFAPES